MDNHTLIEQARAARRCAYAPYSGYGVGAALLTQTGEIFTGCNVENAAYGACLCAERGAVASAVAAGHRDFAALAVVGGLWESKDNEPICTPCGLCRQVLAEFNPDMTVVCGKPNGEPIVKTVRELLPDSFSSDAVKN